MNRDVDEAFICPVCSVQEKHQKILPCLNSCCHDCIHKMASPGCSYRCHVCLEVHDQCISSLPNNLWTEAISDVGHVNDLKNAIFCTACDGIDIATAYCKNCTDFLCRECLAAHRITKLTKTHNLLVVDDKNANQNIVGLLSVDRVIKCPVHSIEDLRYFCNSCEESICCECLIKCHRDHKLASINECGNKQRAELAIALMQSEKKLKSIEESFQKITQMNHNITLNAEQMKQDFSNHMAHCKDLLDNLEKEMRQKIDQKANEKSSSLNEQEKELFDVMKKFKIACKFTQKILQFGNESEMVSIKNHIVRRLKKLAEIRVELQPRDNDVIEIPSIGQDLQKCLVKMEKMAQEDLEIK